jgi:hypothetical protein
MPFNMSFTSVKQIDPITPTVATVQVVFTVSGNQPDLVQVYAFNAAETESKGLGDVVGTIDLKNGQTSFTSTIRLQAGSYYTIALCPRNKNGNTLDDTVEGQYWETFCIYYSLITQASTSPEGATKFPPPTISNVVPTAATITKDCSIIVEWQSTITYDKFLIWWTENGIALGQGENDAKGTSGTWTAAPTRPACYYTFSVKGGVAREWGKYDYSDWGPQIKIIAPPNGTSLRRYLQASGIDPARQGMRGLMFPQSSLRRFMKL